MDWVRKVKLWGRRALIVGAGFLGGLLLGWLDGHGSRDKEEEMLCAEEYEKRLEEEALVEKEEAREEVLSLSDDEFDSRYPAAGRSADQAGDRFVDRCRTYLLKRRSGVDHSGSDGNSPGRD